MSEEIAGFGGGLELAGWLVLLLPPLGVVLVAVVVIEAAATDVVGEPVLVALSEGDADVDDVGDGAVRFFAFDGGMDDAAVLAVPTGETIVVALVSAAELACESCGRDEAYAATAAPVMIMSTPRSPPPTESAEYRLRRPLPSRMNRCRCRWWPSWREP